MSKKLFFDATDRNKEPILEVLKKIVPEKFGTISPINVLEIAAGSGQHAVYFCKEFPHMKWHPTDLEEKHVDSIKSYIEVSQLENIKQPIQFDITELDISQISDLDKEYHLMIAINLVHISPWACSEGLFRAAGKLLAKGGVLLTYGPYSIQGEITPESNIKFNEHLKGNNPEWGLRDVSELESEAKKNELSFDAMFDMPANNKTLLFLKSKN